MKKVAIMLAIAALVANVAWVQAETSKRLSGNLRVGYYNRYITNIGGITAFDHPVFQKNLEVSDAKTGLYGVVWSSFSPKGGFNSDFGDEIDYIIGIRRDFFNGQFGVDFGYGYLNLFDLEKSHGDLHQLYLFLYPPPLEKFQPYLLLEKDFATDKNLTPGGFLYRAGIKYDLKIPAISFLNADAINFNFGFGGHDNEISGRAELISYARLTAAMTFAPVKWLNITPQIYFQKRLGYAKDNGGMAEDKVWYGISFSVPIF